MKTEPIEKIATHADFLKQGKVVTKLLFDDKNPKINLSVDIVFNMRQWFLGELLGEKIGKAQFDSCSTILQNLDRQLEVVFTKVRLKEYGVGG